ncbi:hypothetical protein ACQEU3_14885 [Spirillospora sp. CA-253888]
MMTTPNLPVPASSAAPADLIEAVGLLVADLAVGSLVSPDGAGVDLDTHRGVVQVLPYRPGVTHPARAWSADVTWAALIIYPPATLTTVNTGTGPDPEVYLIPARTFTIEAWDTGGTFQHIDYIDDAEPGVFWIDLEDPARRADLAPYRVTPTLTSGGGDASR